MEGDIANRSVYIFNDVEAEESSSRGSENSRLGTDHPPDVEQPTQPSSQAEDCLVGSVLPPTFRPYSNNLLAIARVQKRVGGAISARDELNAETAAFVGEGGESNLGVSPSCSRDVDRLPVPVGYEGSEEEWSAKAPISPPSAEPTHFISPCMKGALARYSSLVLSSVISAPSALELSQACCQSSIDA